MSQPSPPSFMFGLSYGWSYVLTSFTLIVCGCLPLALLMTLNMSGSGAERANALLAWLPVMAGAIALACAVFFVTVLRTRPHWRRVSLLAMWALAALGMVGWWKL